MSGKLPPITQTRVVFVDSWDEAQKCMDWICQPRPVIAIDTETESFDWWRDRIRLVQIGDEMTGWAIPWDRYSGLIEEVVRRHEGAWVLHNAKFDLKYLSTHGIDLPRAQVHDTNIMAHLMDPSMPTGLKEVSDRHVSPIASAGDKILKADFAKHGWDWATVPIDWQPYWFYGAIDTILTARIYRKFKPAIDASFKDLYDLEMACMWTLLGMEWRGARLDLDYIRRRRPVLWDSAQELRQRGLEEFGIENLGSAKQLGEALIREGWDPLPHQMTNGGKPSTKEAVLKTLDTPLADMVKTMRHHEKICSSYFDILLDLANGDRVHPNIHQLGTRTGRMTVTTPALQTLHRDPEVRDAFIPSDGNQIVCVDFDQMELRVMADLAEVPGLLEAFRTNPDVHKFMAAMTFQVDQADVTKAQRTISKNSTYTRIYGGGPKKFAETAGISEDAARKVYKKVDKAFPEIAEWSARQQKEARDRGNKHSTGAYLYDQYGRYHPVRSSDSVYKLVNYGIQGPCATVLKQKLVDLDMAGYGELMVIPVHDEVVFDVPKEDVEDVIHDVSEIMTCHDYGIPLTVEGKAYDRWGDKYR